MNLHKIVAVTVCGAALSSLGLAMAQQGTLPRPAQPGQPAQPGVQVQVDAQGGQRALWQVNEHTLATCVAISNQEEVALARFAQDRAGSQDVKDFAAMITKDHQAFLRKLERFAPEATRDGYLMDRHAKASGDARPTTAAPQQNSPKVVAPTPQRGVEGNAATNDQGAAATNQQNAGHRGRHHPDQAQHGVSMMQLHKEIAEQCLTDSQDRLSQKEGTEFDKAFIGQQIGMHYAMKEKLIVFQRHATGELNQILASGLETTEHHLNRAEEIMKTLK